MDDGEEIEVTALMGLNFEESTCGDGVCGFPENSSTCSQDCPSGERDEYCDGIKDGKCDPDCASEDDPDCSSFPWGAVGGAIGGAFGFLIVLTITYVVALRRKNRTRSIDSIH